MTDLAPQQRTGLATKAKLAPLWAIIDALLDRKAEFYPRIADGETVVTLGSSAAVREMRAASARWPNLTSDEALDTAISLAKQSLAEVKAQTEYQDQKATRLLTVTTFLSALSGALFSRFEDAYPIHTITIQPIGIGVSLLVGQYAAFAIFILTALSGALVTFYATRTRFRYPAIQTTEDQERDPASLLFYGGLIQSRPRAWMKGWVVGGETGDLGARPNIRHDLKQRYFQNLVSETYLVAAKTADKLRYLEPAQSIFAVSLRCLLLWFILLVGVAIFVPATKKLPESSQASSSVSPLHVRSTAVPAQPKEPTETPESSVLMPVDKTAKPADASISDDKKEQRP